MKARRCALYRLFDDAGRLLYVGTSIDPDRRFSQHRSSKWWWPRVAGVELAWFADTPTARAAEDVALATEASLHNLDDPKRAYYRPRPGPRGLAVVDLHTSLVDLLDTIDAALENS
jgi:predicted GIY-YIG superfamily endonuclease